MSISSIIYNNLCKTKCQAKSLYKKGSELHKHHIIPTHMGGNDTDENYTYLTIREHRIAHYLLWRIHGLPNDLRSFHMLGGNLSSKMRKIVGKWCFENKIGMFSGKYTDNQKDWKIRGIQKQMENKVGIFDPNKTKYHASLGGKASVKKNKSFQYWFSKKGKIKRASMGGKAHKGKKAMYRHGDITFVRVSSDNIAAYLKNGYIFGSPLKPNKGKTAVSKQKKKVSDGIMVYDSITEAAKIFKITPSAVRHRIKSPYFPLKYACDNEFSQ